MDDTNPTGATLTAIIDRYKADAESVYNTWFVGGEKRMKAFRAIGRGVKETVDAIAAGTFGNDFRGSPLEVVLAAITEQKQVFEGAAHPFYWKPKLRIPDIYENEANKRTFGNFLNACLNASREDQLLQELSRLADVGSNRLVISGNADATLRATEERAPRAASKRHLEIIADQQDASEHTQAQHTLIKIGRALKYDVFVARNDRHRVCHGDDFALLTIPRLPDLGLVTDVRDTVELIDVIWLEPGRPHIVCAFEVEHSTSIYSGILRMKDLARSLPDQQSRFYLVAPEVREREVLAQMARPALHEASDRFRLGYLPSGELKQHCDAMCRFGEDHTVLLKIARSHGLRPLKAEP